MIANSNQKSFIDYINNAVIKLPIYFNFLMCIVKRLLTSFLKYLYCFFTYYFFLKTEKRQRQPSNKCNFCNLSSSSDVVYKERWWHWHKLLTDLFFHFVKVLLVYVAKIKMPSNCNLSVSQHQHHLVINKYLYKKKTVNMKVSGFCYDMHFQYWLLLCKKGKHFILNKV